MTRAQQDIPWWVLGLIYAALATAVGFSDYHARPYPDHGFTTYIPEVLAGTAEPPARYRILAPYLFDAFDRVTPWLPVTTWLAFRWLCLVAAFFCGHLYLRTWFDTGRAVAGNLLMAALLPLTFTNSWPNPDQFTELALFTLGCAAAARGAWPAFVGLLVVNALNRETSAFLVLLWFLNGARFDRRHLLRTIAAGALWLGITVALRAWLGFVSYDPWQLWRNIEWLTPLPANFPGYKRIFGWFFIVLLVPLFVLAARSWARQPYIVRMAVAVVAPLYLVVGCLFSSTIESRIFTALLPLLAPAVIFSLLPPDSPSTPDRL